MNNRTLLAYHQELESTKHSVYYMMNKAKIDAFYLRYKNRIQLVFNSMEVLHSKYFERDNEGRLKYETKITAGVPRKEKVLLPGMILANYEVEREKLMNQTLQIIV